MTLRLLALTCVSMFYRSEQDKEPEPEVVAEVTGAGPSEDSTSDGI